MVTELREQEIASVEYWNKKAKKFFKEYNLLLLNYNNNYAIFLNNDFNEHITIFKNNKIDIKKIN